MSFWLELERGKEGRKEGKRKGKRRKKLKRTHLNDLGKLHALLCRALQILHRENLKSRVVDLHHYNRQPLFLSLASKCQGNKKLTNLCATSIFVPCNLATIGVRKFMLSTTLINPCAIASHLTIPPKMFTKIAVTFGSDVIRSNACLIACGVAPPPTSRKLAG